ncbi:MAG TPA: transcriptional regulator [Cytophagales bacterium]|nr:transcriptional regulator [Cytophagales bacterium]HAP58960.1 transcriptional regulator [Cytophagales bacterium]
MAEESKSLDPRLKQIGERLQELRKAKGYTNYEQFAFEAGIARAQYYRYEQGQDLRISSLLKVLDALEITPGEFFSPLPNL